MNNEEDRKNFREFTCYCELIGGLMIFGYGLIGTLVGSAAIADSIYSIKKNKIPYLYEKLGMKI